ncbi:MAG TPA: RodZ domain-containing protein [Candidatus Limnocylindrales bacterium]|nr:RodZ domain-containing protein [Candidatus Limnocylindrales bacterium]
MAPLGESLRAQREKRGITLDQASVDTRIREKFLKALEDDDLRSLLGAVYTKGFLRNYAEYLGLNPDELVVRFHQDRGMPSEPNRKYEAFKPIGRRSLVFTPAVFIPVAVLATIVLFVGYLYYQFTSFAVAPALDVTDPATDAIAQDAAYVVKGHTVATGRVTIRVFPGPLTLADIHPAADGSFTAPLTLTAGPNHIEVEVLDQSGKVNKVNRNVILQPQAAASAPPVKLAVEFPTNGGRVDNLAVVVKGTTDGTSVTINGIQAPITNPGGRFEAHVTTPAGQQTFTIVAKNAAGASVTETRTITVAYTAAVVVVTMRGADAWMQATVDGTVVAGTGRVYKDGDSATFQGREVRIRTGNGAVTSIVHNGQSEGVMGQQGQVVEKIYTAQ